MFDAAVNNAGVVTVPRLDGFKIDVEGGSRITVDQPVTRRARQQCCAAAAAVGSARRPRPGHLSLSPAGVKAAVAAHKPKIVFLTSPNNPDGSVMSTEDLREILELPVLVSVRAPRAGLPACWLACSLRGRRRRAHASLACPEAAPPTILP